MDKRIPSARGELAKGISVAYATHNEQVRGKAYSLLDGGLTEEK